MTIENLDQNDGPGDEECSSLRPEALRMFCGRYLKGSLPEEGAGEIPRGRPIRKADKT